MREVSVVGKKDSAIAIQLTVAPFFCEKSKSIHSTSMLNEYAYHLLVWVIEYAEVGKNPIFWTK